MTDKDKLYALINEAIEEIDHNRDDDYYDQHGYYAWELSNKSVSKILDNLLRCKELLSK